MQQMKQSDARTVLMADAAEQVRSRKETLAAAAAAEGARGMASAGSKEGEDADEEMRQRREEMVKPLMKPLVKPLMKPLADDAGGGAGVGVGVGVEVVVGVGGSVHSAGVGGGKREGGKSAEWTEKERASFCSAIAALSAPLGDGEAPVEKKAKAAGQGAAALMALTPRARTKQGWVVKKLDPAPQVTAHTLDQNRLYFPAHCGPAAVLFTNTSTTRTQV
jgi:hypothetical protein